MIACCVWFLIVWFVAGAAGTAFALLLMHGGSKGADE